MPEKIAVHCRTKELIRKVYEQMGKPFMSKRSLEDQIEQCFGLDWCMVERQHSIETGTKTSYKAYKIISAEQYLKEGGLMEHEFQVGDEVEVIIAQDGMSIGQRGKVTNAKLSHTDKYVNTDMSKSYYALKGNLKLIKKSTSTLKEEDMTKTLRKIRIINKLDDKEMVKDEAITTQTEENFIRSMLLKHSAKLKGHDLEDLHVHPYTITSYEATTKIV